MNFIKKIGLSNLLMLALCFMIIVIAEYLFLSWKQIAWDFHRFMGTNIVGSINLSKTYRT